MSAKSEKAPGFRAEAINVFETCDLPEADQHMITSGLDLEAGKLWRFFPSRIVIKILSYQMNAKMRRGGDMENDASCCLLFEFKSL